MLQRNSWLHDLPVHHGQEPHRLYAFEPLTFSPLVDMEQEWIEGQEDEAHTYRVGQEKDIPECSDVNPSGHLGYYS